MRGVERTSPHHDAKTAMLRCSANRRRRLLLRVAEAGGEATLRLVLRACDLRHFENLLPGKLI